MEQNNNLNQIDQRLTESILFDIKYCTDLKGLSLGKMTGMHKIPPMYLQHILNQLLKEGKIAKFMDNEHVIFVGEKK